MSRGEIATLVADLRQYAGTPAYAAFGKLLAALETHYGASLIELGGDDVLLTQGAARQVIKLQRALAPDSRETPTL